MLNTVFIYIYSICGYGFSFSFAFFHDELPSIGLNGGTAKVRLCLESPGEIKKLSLGAVFPFNFVKKKVRDGNFFSNSHFRRKKIFWGPWLKNFSACLLDFVNFCMYFFLTLEFGARGPGTWSGDPAPPPPFPSLPLPFPKYAQ